MKKRVVILSATYSLSSIFAGLVLHPYQTMQKLVREKVFVWLTLLPSMLVFFVSLVWQFLTLYFLTSSFVNSEVVNFFANIFIFYCIYWQLLLLYLFIRFMRAFRR